MITFDSFSAYDVENDVMRFRCYSGEQLILCGVTRAALVAGASRNVSTRAELIHLYELNTEIIRRAVLNKLERRSRSESSLLLVDIADI